jgi:acyl-coenzyme A synthetase/AMP-(fatty) acid ligase
VDDQGLLVRCAGCESPETLGGPAVLIPTSGTTGAPKLCRHSFAALMGRIRPPRSRSGVARWLLTYLPHGFAGLQIILTALTTESTLVCLSEIDVPRLANAALSHRVTHVSATPTFWRSLLLCLGEEAGNLELEQITLGGEVADQVTLDRLRAVFPRAGLAHIYASTEAGALFSVRDGRAGFPARWLDEAIDDVSLRIRDGSLEVKSPRAMLGYLNNPTSAQSPDGWLSTGDRVEQQGDRVYFLGRQDSLISIGGAKATPEEVESALLGLPGVLDLRAFAVRNPISGFVMGLEVVAAQHTDIAELRSEIIMYARQKLPSYKVPRVIRFVDAVRSDPAGKKSRKPE